MDNLRLYLYDFNNDESDDSYPWVLKFVHLHKMNENYSYENFSNDLLKYGGHLYKKDYFYANYVEFDSINYMNLFILKFG
jgi:hypothetical protein